MESKTGKKERNKQKERQREKNVTRNFELCSEVAINI
jgi:hypothetical protein